MRLPTRKEFESGLLFCICAYESAALVPGSPLPPITHGVKPMPRWGRGLVAGGWSAWFFLHFEVFRRDAQSTKW